jgi:hypothetical protein
VGKFEKEVGGDGMNHKDQTDHLTLAEEGLRTVEEVDRDWDIVVIEPWSELWCDGFD